MTEHQLGLAVNGREHQLGGRLVSFPLIAGLLRESGDVRYYDPLMPVLTAPGGLTLNSEPDPGTDWDLVIVHTTRPDVDNASARKCHVLDATCQFDDAPDRVVV